tara:strand:+ start:2466 stop:3530 length:1065 start_codon:yes stop_codon:yes gene_type:complete
MKLSSLFKHKAYAFNQPSDTDQDCKFAKQLLKKVKPKLKVSKITLSSVCDDYDIFYLTDEKGIFFKLKISLSDIKNILKKEITALRSLGKQQIPKYVCHGKVKIGDEVEYLLTKAVESESIRNIGRSVLVENMQQFFANYFEFTKTRAVRNSYKDNITKFYDSLDPEKELPEESVKAIKSYTDYDKCKEFFIVLKKEIDESKNQLEGFFKHKCHGNLVLDSIFYNNHFFYLDNLDQTCMGHPYIDLCDVILDSGLSKQNDIQILDKFCSEGSIDNDRELFYSFLQLQLRKKLGALLLTYIREVYVYDSYRYDKIIEIADTFSHLYERFCEIPIFNDNKNFIMKTICEPIFGVKA